MKPPRWKIPKLQERGSGLRKKRRLPKRYALLLTIADTLVAKLAEGYQKGAEQQAKDAVREEGNGQLGK